MRIKELTLYTTKLVEQTAFYAEVLELKILKQSKLFTAFRVGNSTLKLVYKATATPYHYAINIPANKEQEALQWLKKRVEILPYKGQEIQYFDFWDAHAIYFYDKDGNIGELIARKTLQNDSDALFDSNLFLKISEIGIPTLDVKREFDILNVATNVPIYSGSLERFCAVGDAKGLFILINKELKKEWFPTKDSPYSSDFNIRIIEGNQVFDVVYKNEKLTVSAV